MSIEKAELSCDLNSDDLIGELRKMIAMFTTYEQEASAQRNHVLAQSWNQQAEGLALAIRIIKLKVRKKGL